MRSALPACVQCAEAAGAHTHACLEQPLRAGGQYDCGTTDVTRTFHMGTPTDHQRLCFTRVLQVPLRPLRQLRLLRLSCCAVMAPSLRMSTHACKTRPQTLNSSVPVSVDTSRARVAPGPATG